jgi:sulfane dehydrogenase subunit SoxC
MGLKSSSRRELLQGSALAVGAVATGAVGSLVSPALADTTKPYSLNNSPMIATPEDILAYGQRSKYEKSIRIHEAEKPEATLARYRDFGLTLHVSAPIGDFIGTMAPTSTHYFATTKGALLPDIDPKEHTLTIQGLVDRPLILTMEDLKRFPSVSRFHFVECAANNHTATQKTVQASHGFTSSAEWTGVLLSTLLKEAGVKSNAKWFIAEGAEEIKGADTIPLTKGMDDVIVAYGMNGEAVRPSNGYPLRLIVPGFEGIFNTKWLRRIDVVENYQLNMDDFGHLRRDAAAAALGYQIGVKSVITTPSGSQKLPNQGYYEISGLAWSGQGKISKVEISTDSGKTWNTAVLKGTVHPMAHTRFGYMFKWEGGEHVIMSRAYDEVGQMQQTAQEAAKALGATYAKGYRPPGNNNLIMAWKIAKDGAVTNGLDAIA